MVRKKKSDIIEEEITPIEKLIIPPSSTTISIGEVEVEVKSKLSLSEVIAFTESVVNSIVDHESSNVKYDIKDYIIGVNTLAFYTDLRLPKSVEKQYEILTQTDILEQIMDYIDEKQYWHILDSIDEQLRFEEAKIQNQFRAETQECIEQVKAEAEVVLKEVNALLVFMQEAFKGVDPEMVSKLLPKFAEMGKPDETKMVDAYLSATQGKPDLRVIK